MSEITRKFTRASFAIVTTATMLFATVEPSSAAFVLKLEDVTDGAGGAYGAVIPDGGVGDTHGDAGVIVFNGAIFKPGSGRNFNINVTTGISKPSLPTTPGVHSELDLNSVNVNTSGAGILRITLEDTGFTAGGPRSGTALVTLNQLCARIVEPDLGPPAHPAAAVADTGTTALAGNTASFAPTAFSSGTGAFSATGQTPFANPNGTYSMFAQVTISFTGGGSVSFDFDTLVVPQPATLWLLGIGLLGMLGAAVRVLPRRTRRG